MKSTLPETRIARLDVARVDIGKLNAGPLTVGRLVLEPTRFDLSSGAVRLRNLQVTVGLRMVLEWEVSVSILGFPKRWDGTIDLKDQEIIVNLGDIDLPGLESFSIDVPNLTVDNISAVVGPLSDLQLGALIIEQVNAQSVVAPVPDFALSGLDLGSATVTGLAIPGATAAKTQFGRVQGQAFPLGTVTLPPLTLPQANIGEVRAQAVDVNKTSNPFEYFADAGILKVTLRVIPSARMRADELAVTGLKSSGSIGRIELTDVVLPYEVLDVTLSELGIQTIEIPTIEVS